jgi:hypothetical protein
MFPDPPRTTTRLIAVCAVVPDANAVAVLMMISPGTPEPVPPAACRFRSLPGKLAPAADDCVVDESNAGLFLTAPTNLFPIYSSFILVLANRLQIAWLEVTSLKTNPLLESINVNVEGKPTVLSSVNIGAPPDPPRTVSCVTTASGSPHVIAPDEFTAEKLTA